MKENNNAFEDILHGKEGEDFGYLVKLRAKCHFACYLSFTIALREFFDVLFEERNFSCFYSCPFTQFG